MAMINWSNDFSVNVASELVNRLHELTTYTVYQENRYGIFWFLV